MKNIKKMKSMMIAAALLAEACLAETTPVMVSLVTPVQAPGSDYDVAGLRLDLIYGRSRDFKGLDLGIVNHATGDFTGLAVGGVNVADRELIGAQVGFVNWNANGRQPWESVSYGMQFGLLNNADSFCGLQDGFVNVSRDDFTGAQSGLLNIANDLRGVQLGEYFILGVNFAPGSVRGLQLGIVNYAGTVESGVQVGFVNIIASNGWMPIFPIVNGNF